MPDRESEGTTQEEVAPHSYEVTILRWDISQKSERSVRMDSLDRNSETKQKNSTDQSRVIELVTDADSQRLTGT